MPVAAGVVSDLGVAARLVLAAHDMPAERCRSAVLDRRHHLELAEADMAGVGLAPRRSMAAEDIRNLQPWTLQQRPALGGRLGASLLLGLVLDLVLLGPQRREAIKRAHDRTDRVGGDAGVERRRFQFGMSKKHLDHTNIDILLKQVSRKGVPLMPSSA